MDGLTEATKQRVVELIESNMKKAGVKLSLEKPEDETSIGKQLADEKKSESKAQKAQKDYFTSETKQDEENWGF